MRRIVWMVNLVGICERFPLAHPISKHWGGCNLNSPSHHPSQAMTPVREAVIPFESKHYIVGTEPPSAATPMKPVYPL